MVADRMLKELADIGGEMAHLLPGLQDDGRRGCPVAVLFAATA
jgi:hypothetical protein